METTYTKTRTHHPQTNTSQRKKWKCNHNKISILKVFTVRETVEVLQSNTITVVDTCLVADLDSQRRVSVGRRASLAAIWPSCRLIIAPELRLRRAQRLPPQLRLWQSPTC